MSVNDEAEVDEAELDQQARIAVLRAIIDAAPNNPGGALQLAEAYAWLLAPAEPHGGARISVQK